MFRIDNLRQERSSVHTIQMQINRMQGYVCFYEGKDDILFYNHYIRQKHTESFEVIMCCGQKNVLELLNNLQFKTNLKPLFFIDKDFDDYLEKTITDDALFITDGYSFENYLVTREALNILMQDYCNLPSDKRLNYLNKFYIAYDIFINNMHPLMEWAVNCKKSNQDINLNNIDLSNFRSFFELSQDLVLTFNHNYQDEFKRLSQTENYYITIEINLDISEYDKWIRGKFALFFLLIFFEKIQEILKIKDKVNNPKELIKFLSPRISIPATLDAFLSRHIHLKKRVSK